MSNNVHEPQEEYVVSMEHITKRFPGIVANDDVSLQLKKGEVHALLGENGAGKSTLMSVLFGMYKPEEGLIKINGNIVNITSPNEANKYKIGMVHQHFMLVDCFTGLENIILGAEPTDKLGIIHVKEVKKKIQALCETYHFKVDLDKKISSMTVGMQQKVEILKMLYRENEILIFDEPTAVLTPQEIEELMISIKNLAAEGKSILFISHKLNEIMEIADRITVLRKGKCIGTVNKADVNINDLSTMMVGRPVQLVVSKRVSHPGRPILSVRNLSMHSYSQHKDLVKHVSFDVRQGEITCIAGIEGNGQSELIYGITGLSKIYNGHVYIRNIPIYNKKTRKEQIGCVNITRSSIRKRNKNGISHIPEDRHRYGLVLDFPLKNNLVLENYNQKPYAKWGFTRFGKIEKYAEKTIEKYDIRSGQGGDSITRSMSGGNQQKAIVGRELDRNKPVLIACQPTRGLDVGAIEYIHKQIVAHRDAGKAVLLMSMELEEVMNLADRILVMYEGQIVADVKPKDTSLEELGLYMSGAKKMTLEEPDIIKTAQENEKLALVKDVTYHYEDFDENGNYLKSEEKEEIQDDQI